MTGAAALQWLACWPASARVCKLHEALREHAGCASAGGPTCWTWPSCSKASRRAASPVQPSPELPRPAGPASCPASCPADCWPVGSVAAASAAAGGRPAGAPCSAPCSGSTGRPALAAALRSRRATMSQAACTQQASDASAASPLVLAPVVARIRRARAALVRQVLRSGPGGLWRCRRRPGSKAGLVTVPPCLQAVHHIQPRTLLFMCRWRGTTISEPASSSESPISAAREADTDTSARAVPADSRAGAWLVYKQS
jgi:hypothetical protein